MERAADLHYVVFDDPENGVLATDEDGNVLTVKPEYVTMSRRPGIGRFGLISTINVRLIGTMWL